MVSAAPNPVYAMVRECLRDLGLDAANFGTAEWNPLGAYIAPGSSVFLLCNFVYHQRPVEDERALWAKCTHGAVLRAIADYVLIATGPEGRVLFGNSSLQSCDFERVLRETGAARVAEFYADQKLPVSPKDLRLRVAPRTLGGRVSSVTVRDDAGGVEVDLGGDSLLDAIPGAGPRQYRISDYDPGRIEQFHAAGAHRYLIHRDVLESDVVLSVPKLKTHEKVGITCALKGFVGTVGHKDCLAHHRFGNPKVGGDEYPDRFAFMRGLSRFHDWINRRASGGAIVGGAQIAERMSRRVLYRLGVIGGGAWSGNDTAWRMTLDLARIVHFADASGRMQDTPQRRHLALLDGIIAGEGQGPLAPDAVDAGTLVFADDVSLCDRIACRLMGYEPEQIRLVHEAPAVLGSSGDARVLFNGEALAEDAVKPAVGRPFATPAGWVRALGAVS
ncbi:hypothetical protein ABI59_04875 [Acidobacteria bacterium Mor1]|nr:hypothetical protein ABI59_04875 [Acidobacteria bacterium Mor1]